MATKLVEVMYVKGPGGVVRVSIEIDMLTGVLQGYKVKGDVGSALKFYEGSDAKSVLLDGTEKAITSKTGYLYNEVNPKLTKLPVLVLRS